MNVPLKSLAVATLTLVLASGPAHALFKVVGPDGSVTYTDRAPQGLPGKVIALGRSGAEVPPEPVENPLPAELRMAAARYPVVLYTAPECGPCGVGRAWLLQRGVPYVERVVNSDEATLALERAVGARSVPALTVGAQVLRGFSPADWSAYLDAAGYPKESRLPRGWAAPPPEPLVPRPTAVAASPRPAAADARGPAPADAAEDPATPPPANPAGLRF
jgi:glutaredoxin